MTLAVSTSRTFRAGGRDAARVGGRRIWGQLQGHLRRNLFRRTEGAWTEAGTDLEYQVSVDFWTAVRGGVARLEIQRQETCPTCKGKSTTGGSIECPECHGSGQVTQMGGRMKFNIQCPRCNGTGKIQNGCPTCDGEGVVTRAGAAGVPHQAGHPRRPADPAGGQGQRGHGRRRGGRPVPDHQGGNAPGVHARGRRYSCNRPGYGCKAALGAKIEVPTIDTHDGGGRTQLKIPPGTQTGQKLRLREKGVPSAAHEGKRGDEIVEVKIVVPKVQDERSKEILRELAKLNPEDPRAELLAEV